MDLRYNSIAHTSDGINACVRLATTDNLDK